MLSACVDRHARSCQFAFTGSEMWSGSPTCVVRCEQVGRVSGLSRPALELNPSSKTRSSRSPEHSCLDGLEHVDTLSSGHCPIVNASSRALAQRGHGGCGANLAQRGKETSEVSRAECEARRVPSEAAPHKPATQQSMPKLLEPTITT